MNPAPSPVISSPRGCIILGNAGNEKLVSFERCGWTQRYWVVDTKKSQWSFRVDLKEIPKDNIYIDKNGDLENETSI